MNIELPIVLWPDEQPAVSLNELAELSGLSATELRELVDCGVIVPAEPGAPPEIFHADCILVTRTAYRLRNDFELEAQGLALVLTLLDRIRDLQAQMRDLSARLPHRMR